MEGGGVSSTRPLLQSRRLDLTKATMAIRTSMTRKRTQMKYRFLCGIEVIEVAQKPLLLVPASYYLAAAGC